MARGDKYLYPVTKRTLHRYAESIFAPIRRDECATTVWVPMSGRRMWNKFIIENIYLFEKQLPNYDKYFLIYVEPLDLTEESMLGYMRLMGKSFLDACDKKKECKKIDSFGSSLEVFNDDSASYRILLEALRQILNKVGEQGFRVVFFLGEFDELSFVNRVFFNNLKSIWSGLYPVVQYVFLMRGRVTRQENIDKWGELNEAILQNIAYVPLGNQENIDYLIDYFSNSYSVSFDKEKRKLLAELCGGHPYLLKASTRLLSKKKNSKLDKKKLKEVLKSYYELQSVSRGILNIRTPQEKKILRRVAVGKDLKPLETDNIFGFLLKLGLIIMSSNGGYKLFGLLFKDAVLSEAERFKQVGLEEKKLTLDSESGAILLDGKTVEEEFTYQEYSVLRMFLEDREKLKERGDIGDVLWGKQSYEKYSDWAIDQLISKLRKKLTSLGIENKLVTIRGRGYKFV